MAKYICPLHPTAIQYSHLQICPIPLRPERCECGSNNLLVLRGRFNGSDTFLCLGCEKQNSANKCGELLVMFEQEEAFRE